MRVNFQKILHVVIWKLIPALFMTSVGKDPGKKTIYGITFYKPINLIHFVLLDLYQHRRYFSNHAV